VAGLRVTSVTGVRVVSAQCGVITGSVGAICRVLQALLYATDARNATSASGEMVGRLPHDVFLESKAIS
jgi:hypothetical protein